MASSGPSAKNKALNINSEQDGERGRLVSSSGGSPLSTATTSTMPPASPLRMGPAGGEAHTASPSRRPLSAASTADSPDSNSREYSALPFDSQSETAFSPVRTLHVTVFTLALLIAFLVQIFLPAATIKQLVVSSVFLFVYLVAQYAYLRHEHKRVQSLGYLQFYRTARSVFKLPLWVAIGCNSIFLFLLSLWTNPDHAVHLERAELISVQVISTLEFIFAFLPTVYYYFLCTRFNRTRSFPDARNELSAPLNAQSFSSMSWNTKFRPAERVIQEQSDFIKVLQDKHENLNKEITRLRHEIDVMTRKRNAGYAQDLDSITAERNYLKSELNKALDEHSKYNNRIHSLQEDNQRLSEQLEEITLEMSQLQKQNNKLSLMVEVEREVNADAQEVIDNINDQVG